MTTVAGAGPAEARNLEHQVSVWPAGVQACRPSSAFLPCVLAAGCVGSRAPGVRTESDKLCRCCKWWFNLLHLNDGSVANFMSLIVLYILSFFFSPECLILRNFSSFHSWQTIEGHLLCVWNLNTPTSYNSNVIPIFLWSIIRLWSISLIQTQMC